MGNSFFNYNVFHVEYKNLVNVCSLTTKFCSLIMNHPSSTLRLLYMTMQLRLGQVTLLQMECPLLNCPHPPQSDLHR